jgi:ATP-dependent Lhr-like helicase
VGGVELLRAWFARRGWTPHPFQERAWRSFLDGRSGVVHVPTGAGKTYAAYGGPLAAMIDELRDSGGGVLAGPRLLYVTPLRAVARDIEKALRLPIEESGLGISVESRTGDTSASVRNRQRDRLPNVLVTTPESLTLLLARANSRELLAPCRAVIVDEWHELLSSKRGTQTELALASLRGFCPGLRTWALSATLSNLDEAAHAAAGVDDDPEVISAPVDRPISIHTVLPARPDAFPFAGHLGLSMLNEVVEALDPARSTLLFTNTRSQAERWHHAILQERPEWARHTALHHGSIDRAERERIERGLKDGSVRLVVATSSLDLGVDFSPVEEVYQIGSSKGIARLMQRAGRSAHRPGAPCRITCVPTYGLELLEVDAVRRAIAAGVIEPRLPLNAPLDVLAQHLVTCALGGGFRADELYGEVRRAWSYRDLGRADFDWVLDLVKTGGATLWAYPDYRRLVEEEGSGLLRVSTRRIAQLHRLNVGTIVADASVALCYPSGRKLGNIEENFVSKLRPGEKFLFAGRVLEFVRMRDLTAYARRSRGSTTFTPIWSGTRLPNTESLSEWVRRSLELARDGVTDSPELAAASRIVEVQSRLSIVPGADELLVELCRTREGRHVFLFPFDGRLVHAGLAAVLALRLARRLKTTFSIAVNDYGLELLSTDDVDAEPLITPEIFTRDRLVEDVADSVNMVQLTRSRFREVARVSGLVFQSHPGVHKSARQVHASAGLLYDVFNEFDPGNLLLHQARREVLDREFEQSRLARSMERLRHASLRILRVSRPTPLGFPLILERVGGKLTGQSLHERIEAMKRQWETGSSKSAPPANASS